MTFDRFQNRIFRVNDDDIKTIQYKCDVCTLITNYQNRFNMWNRLWESALFSQMGIISNDVVTNQIAKNNANVELWTQVEDTFLIYFIYAVLPV